MKKNDLIGIGTLIFTVIIYFFYPSPILVAVMAVLATLLFLNLFAWWRRQNISKHKASMAQHNPQKRKKKKK